MKREAPAERVRARLSARSGDHTAQRMPSGYQRVGRVLLLRLPEALRPYYRLIGEAWVDELGVTSVLRYRGGMAGELRLPDVELIAGSGTETEVVEHGIRYRFDAARIMFAAGNRTERQRAGRLVREGETVVDLFAGIGYFALPAAVVGRASRVYACEKNPVSLSYLTENARLNDVSDRVVAVPGDNRTAEVPLGVADRIFLGYLPTSLPWLARAVALLKRSGGNVHAHLISGTREGLPGAESEVRQQLERLGAVVGRSSAREVKPYGPGRLHAVVDAAVEPPREPGGPTRPAPGL